MNTFWKLSTGMLLGASLVLSGCDLGNSDGNTDTGGATPPPVTPIAYTGASTAASFTTGNQNKAGGAAANTSGGLINNAANGGLGNIIGPISVVASATPRASNATIVSLFSSLNFDGQNQPVAVVSQQFENPKPCQGQAALSDAITYYLSGAYIVVKFDNACLAVLPGATPANEATIKGQVVVTVSDDGDHYTFTPSNLTVTDNTTTTYNVPAGTYALDNGALSILVPCHNNKKVCKITAPTDLSATSPYSFTDATVSDPELGHFNVAGTGLVLCAAGDGGTPDSPFQAGGSLTLTTVPASLTVTVTFGGCGVDPVITP